MFRWLPYSFVRITLFFLCGILFAIYHVQAIAESIAFALFAVLLSVYFILAFYQRAIQRQFLFTGLIAAGTLFLSGYLLVIYKTQANDSRHFLYHGDSIRYYRAEVTQQPQEKDRSWKMEASVTAIYTDHWSDATGKILLYYSKEDTLASWEYGDVLLIKGTPAEVKVPSNPGEFDYKQFLSYRNIYHQHFLRQGSVQLLGNVASGPLKYSIQARKWAEGVLKHSITGFQQQSIATALVLGVTGELDPELMNAYATTGTTHILSVSGLHVSIIYMLLLMLLKPLTKTTTGKWIIALISIVVLWAYAFISGLSPSVLRAVTMFTCMALARPWKRSSSIYNTLAVSAFLLLCYDPFLIMAVGFQLSYLAVIGIVYLHPSIYSLWEIKNMPGDECWKMTSVSLAAQIATLPLTLFYFHQFPTYFLLANLVIIPASSAVLILGVATVCLGYFPVVAGAIGWLTNMIIGIMNWIVFRVEAFPASRMDNIFLTSFQSWTMAVMIVLLLGLFHFRRYSFAIGLAAFAIIFSISQWIYIYREMSQRRFVVYNIPRRSALDLIHEGKVISFHDSVLMASPQLIRYQVQPCRVASLVQRIVPENDRVSTELNGGRLIRWQGKTILQVTSGEFRLPVQLTADFVVISNNALPCSPALRTITSARFILDSSNSFYFVKTFLEKAAAENIPVYSVLHEGAFVSLN